MKTGRLFLILSLIVSIMVPLGFKAVNASEVKYSNAETTQYDEKFRSSDIFKKYEQDLTSQIPIENVEIVDENGVVIGWNIKYEIYKENSEEKGFSEKVTSLLTYLYEKETNEEHFYLLDYSKISTSNNVELVNLRTNEVEETYEINGKVESLANDINKKKDDLTDITEAPAASYFCKWWVCTQTETGGGYWNDPCMIIGSALCTLAKPTVLNLTCQGANAIGCYVPKYKVCINGYWETKYCPIEA